MNHILGTCFPLQVRDNRDRDVELEAGGYTAYVWCWSIKHESEGLYFRFFESLLHFGRLVFAFLLFLGPTDLVHK